MQVNVLKVWYCLADNKRVWSPVRYCRSNVKLFRLNLPRLIQPASTRGQFYKYRQFILMPRSLELAFWVEDTFNVNFVKLRP